MSDVISADLMRDRSNNAREASRNADAAWKAAASTVGGVEWRKRVNATRDKQTRTHVASIVWWDFCAGDGNTMTQLDALREQYAPNATTDVGAIRAGLVAAGYPDHMAGERIKTLGVGG
jgi:hypothetical protein